MSKREELKIVARGEAGDSIDRVSAARIFVEALKNDGPRHWRDEVHQVCAEARQLRRLLEGKGAQGRPDPREKSRRREIEAEIVRLQRELRSVQGEAA